MDSDLQGLFFSSGCFYKTMQLAAQVDISNFILVVTLVSVSASVNCRALMYAAAQRISFGHRAQMHLVYFINFSGSRQDSVFFLYN